MSDILIFLSIIGLSGLKPGPGALFFMSLTSTEGIKTALITGLGTDIAHFIIIFALILGLDLVKSYPLLMLTLQITSCFYIGYLGLSYIFKEQQPSPKRSLNAKTNIHRFTEGFIWCFANPLNLAIYGSLIPFMITKNAVSNINTALIIATISLLIYFCTRLPYLLLAKKIATYFNSEHNQIRRKKLTGLFFAIIALIFLTTSLQTLHANHFS